MLILMYPQRLTAMALTSVYEELNVIGLRHKIQAIDWLRYVNRQKEAIRKEL